MISLEHLSGFGDALKELRWRARMKQVEVCRATGMTAPQVSRYENGHEMPTVESLVRYLNAVSADLCDLQKVLVTGQAPPQPGTSKLAGARRLITGDDQPTRESILREARQRQAATRQPANEPPSAIEQVLDDADQRLGSSSALQEIVSGLVKLNLEGMERMERRMQSMEASMADLKGDDEDRERDAG